MYVCMYVCMYRCSNFCNIGYRGNVKIKKLELQVNKNKIVGWKLCSEKIKNKILEKVKYNNINIIYI